MISDNRSNVVLIGMPGSGKSTIGKRLAAKLGCPFVDTDAVIEKAHGCILQDIVDSHGHIAFRALEERTLCELDLSDTVIGTGGSAVYSERAMAALRASGTVVYLKISFANLEPRLTNMDTRGIARKAGQSLQDLYEERAPLYQRHADVTVDCDGLDEAGVVEKISRALTAR